MSTAAPAGAGGVLGPSVATVEALTGDARDAAVSQVRTQVDLEERLPLTHARAATSRRQGTGASAVDAVVAEAALRPGTASLITGTAGRGPPVGPAERPQLP